MQTEEQQNPEEKAGETLIKTPSKMFTDYYGSVFFLLIAVYVAAGFFIIKPKIETTKQIEAQTKATETEIQNDKVYFDGLSRSVAAAQAISPDVLKKVEMALPSSADIPGLLVQLDAATKDTGVVLTNVNFESSATKAQTQAAQPINMTMALRAADYSVLKKFIANIENNLRMFDVQSLSFSGDKEITFTLQVRTYYYPPVKKN